MNKDIYHMMLAATENYSITLCDFSTLNLSSNI